MNEQEKRQIEKALEDYKNGFGHHARRMIDDWVEFLKGKPSIDYHHFFLGFLDGVK